MICTSCMGKVRIKETGERGEFAGTYGDRIFIETQDRNGSIVQDFRLNELTFRLVKGAMRVRRKNAHEKQLENQIENMKKTKQQLEIKKQQEWEQHKCKGCFYVKRINQGKLFCPLPVCHKNMR